MTPLPVVAITMGDPAGIGPELCLRMLRDSRVDACCIPLVFGDAALLQRVSEACGLPLEASVVRWEAWRNDDAPPARGQVVDCGALDASLVRPGVVDAVCGRAAFVYIERAIRAALSHKVDAVATAPIHKESLRLSGVPQPGHTEIFGELTGSQRFCMMLASDELIVTMVTGHIGYAEVPNALSAARVLDVIELTAAAGARLRRPRPRIVVCGLNPHAGEHGLFGDGEEERAILPAIREAASRGIDVTGPLPPDSAFLPSRRRITDAFVCMYHDQGHIPFKMIAFDTGVNITLGLPIVRTSVDHGTAFDIAWTGRADATSLLEAVRWAARLVRGTSTAPAGGDSSMGISAPGEYRP